MESQKKNLDWVGGTFYKQIKKCKTFYKKIEIYTYLKRRDHLVYLIIT